MNSILLHVCCAPCACIPVSSLLSKDHTFATFFYNPNIHPQEEYQKRLDTYISYAHDAKVKVILGEYAPQMFHETISEHSGVYPLVKESLDYAENLAKRKTRCRLCYKLRFNELAKTASENGFEAIGTTLSISPYQFSDEIKKTLSEMAKKWGVASAFEDYSNIYFESVERSKSLGMYRQNYCGCCYSKQEAEIERAARKAARKVK